MSSGRCPLCGLVDVIEKIGKPGLDVAQRLPESSTAELSYLLGIAGDRRRWESDPRGPRLDGVVANQLGVDVVGRQRTEIFRRQR